MKILKKILILVMSLLFLSLSASIIKADITFIRASPGLLIFLLSLFCLFFFHKDIAKNISISIILISLLLIPEYLLTAFDYNYSRPIGTTQTMVGKRIEKSVFNHDSELFWITGPSDRRYKNFAYGQRPIPQQQIDINVGVFGDSVTASGAPPYGVILEKIMKNQLENKNIFVSIYGVAGYTSYQGKLMLQRVLNEGTKLNYAVLFFGYNDHWLAFWGKEDKAIKNSGKFVLLRDTMKFSRLAALFVEMNDKIRGKSKESIKQDRLNAPYRVSIEDYRVNLTEMIDICRKNQIVPILVTAPLGVGDKKVLARDIEVFMRWEVLRPETEPRKLHNSYNNVVRELAKEKVVPLVDLDLYFHSNHFDSRKGFYPREPVHPKQDGYVEMGKEIAKLMLFMISNP